MFDCPALHQVRVAAAWLDVKRHFFILLFIPLFILLGFSTLVRRVEARKSLGRQGTTD
jgi:hypothetical protein